MVAVDVLCLVVPQGHMLPGTADLPPRVHGPQKSIGRNLGNRQHDGQLADHRSNGARPLSTAGCADPGGSESRSTILTISPNVSSKGRRELTPLPPKIPPPT